jgi:iron complex outermembrane receptor protein
LNKKTTLSRSIAVALGMTATLGVAEFSSAEQYMEEVVTVGTRSKARSVEDSPAPVDVLSGDYFVNQGETDLSNLLRNVVPSYNVNTQPISDAATIVRPANLRGLAPDHTLVLINGKRRHRGAVIYWLGNGIANGAQGPDISLIPSIALKQVEVLRDGAAAQYGSDAIAGVMNFVLKDNSEGIDVEARYGQYSEGDGDQYAVAANIGLPFTDSGFANFSFEYSSSDPTDRSVQRNDAAALIAAGNTAVANPAQIWGSPLIDDNYKLFGNIGLDLGGGTEFYAHANYAKKFVDGGFYFRNPNTRGAVFSTDGGATLLVGDMLDAADGVLDGSAGCPTVTITNNVPDAAALAQVFADPNCFTFQEIFPGGFTPRFGGDVHDAAIVAGVRGESGDFGWDISAGAGSNEVDFFIRNTVNASLGPATPTAFDPGAYTQTEQNLNADFTYSPSPELNVGFGAEYRIEEFEIRVGQQESFEIGPLAPQGFSAASNGFPGFSNIAGGIFDRSNKAVYVDVEYEPTQDLLIGGAVRFEDFADFGSTTNYKIAANWRATETFGVRATASTGFKAPTPGQSNAFNVSTEFDFALGDLVNNGTVPSTTAVAALRGGRPLEPEESTNLTFGVFFNVGGLDVTVDYFNIEVEDRLNLSANYSLTPAEVTQLVAEGVTSAANLQNFRFFTNDFDTETTGIDVVATYGIESDMGDTQLSLAFNTTETEVTDAGVTVDAARIRQIEEGLPETRWNAAANHFYGDLRLLGRVSYYDDWYDSEDGNTYSGKYLVDAEVAYTFNEATTITLGAQNLFDEVPDDNPGAAAGVGNRYGQFSPFGFNGAFYYMKVEHTLE